MGGERVKEKGANGETTEKPVLKKGPKKVYFNPRPIDVHVEVVYGHASPMRV